MTMVQGPDPTAARSARRSTRLTIGSASLAAHHWPDTHWDDPPDALIEEELFTNLDVATINSFKKIRRRITAKRPTQTPDDDTSSFDRDNFKPLPPKVFPHGLTRGYIVLSYFPHAEAPWIRPGPTARPSLVLGSAIYSSIPYVVLAYGTSIKEDKKNRQWGPSMKIDKKSEIEFCGLDRATEFFFSRLAILPASREYISVNADGAVVAGKIRPQRQRVLRSMIWEIWKLSPEVGMIAGNDYAFCHLTKRMLRQVNEPERDKKFETSFRAAKRTMQTLFTGQRSWR